MCRRETSTAAVSGGVERGSGGRGAVMYIIGVLADGGGQFREKKKPVTAKTKGSPKFMTKKKTRTEESFQAASLSKSFYD
jgi:hypothetical protein